MKGLLSNKLVQVLLVLLAGFVAWILLGQMASGPGALFLIVLPFLIVPTVGAAVLAILFGGLLKAPKKGPDQRSMAAKAVRAVIFTFLVLFGAVALFMAYVIFVMGLPA